MAWATSGRLFLFVESSEGRLRKAAEDVWQLVHSSDGGLDPKLDSLLLFDEDSNDNIARAGVGLEENLRRNEIAIPISVGAITAVVVLVAVVGYGATWDLAIGSIPALVAAIIAAGWLLADTRARKLVWR